MSIPIIVGALAAISSISQSGQQAKQAERAADIAGINRHNALAAGNANEEAQRRQARMALGEQRAALAQAGIGLDGSAADVYEQSVQNAEMDALNIRYRGILQANGFENEQLQQQENASSIRKSTIFRAGTSALSAYATSSYLTGGGLLGTQAPAPVSDAAFSTVRP